MGEKRNTYRVLVGKSEGREPLENVVLDGRILLKLSRSRMEVVERIRLAQEKDSGRVLGTRSGSIQCGKFVCLRNCYLSYSDSAPQNQLYNKIKAGA
jgi:hypothetical protein